MKSIKILGSIILLASLTVSCSAHLHTNSTTIPPGQAKKITGAQSAKDYAPGQQKDKGND